MVALVNSGSTAIEATGKFAVALKSALLNAAEKYLSGVYKVKPFFDNDKAHFLGESEFENADDLPQLLDFPKETSFTITLDALEKGLADATRCLNFVSKTNETFSLVPDKLFLDVDALITVALETKAENIALGSFL